MAWYPCTVQALTARFLEHVKARKTVALDELAAEFGLKTQDAIARLQALEADGRLTGVMDDRGKVQPCYCAVCDLLSFLCFPRDACRWFWCTLCGERSCVRCRA
jgi:hypothetical protein